MLWIKWLRLVPRCPAALNLIVRSQGYALKSLNA
jgi:hypothetical protein